MNKLTIDQKIAIAQASGKALRATGNIFNVHHSTISDIQKESCKVLTQFWKSKSAQIGRPKIEVPADRKEMEALEKQVKELKSTLAKKDMKIDYLEMKLKWADERASEKGIKLTGNLKKKKK